MIIKTPPLSIKKVSVFAALFKAQLPDTLSAIHNALPDWMAVHVGLEQTGALRKTLTKEEMRDEILANLGEEAAVLTPIYRLTSPEIPPNTIATIVPGRLRPKLAPEYQDWKYVCYPEAREALDQLMETAVGGTPEGQVGIADALVKGQLKGQAVLDGWSGSVSIPQFKRTLEGMVEPESTVVFWETAFGFEAKGDAFLKMADRMIGMPDAKHDRVYFDSTNYSWFIAFYPGGQMRVAMLG